MEKLKQSRAVGFAVIAAVYLLAAVVGILLYRALSLPVWLGLLIADAAATVVTFLFSLLFRNASVYDPYWSVQPILIVTAFAIGHRLTPAGWLLLVCVWVWGVRLTANWAYTFHGLAHEDWRYGMLRETTGSLYFAVNFIGIHMVPTLIVYACVLPAVFTLGSGADANAGSVIGAAVCLSAVALQCTADLQMQRFRRQGTGGLIRVGLWKHARHPNYLGEIAMWWGIALQAVSVMPEKWWLFSGALANTLLFLLVSIPMADRRQARKPGYPEYRAATRALLPIPKIMRRKTAGTAGPEHEA